MCTLFVVDDDITYQRIIKLTLLKYSVFKHVLYFDEGKQLLNYLTEFNQDHSNLPDLIFLDLNMPGLDGWAVLDAFSQIQKSFAKKILVYIVTVSIRDVDRERAMGYDCVADFISKPLYKEKIISIVESFNNDLSLDSSNNFPLN
jgi:CheY-like chemotaxis protein